MAKKPVKLSKNEKKAAAAGVSVRTFNNSKKTSSNNSGKLEAALKSAGVWDSYQKMSPDQKTIIEGNYAIGIADSKDKAKKLSDALEEATKQADPYWKSFLKVAKDEVSRAFDDTKNDYSFQKNELENNILRISEDLSKNRDFYTLEQQSDLAKLKQSYEQQRDGVIEDAASKGLTFSTKREVPLQQLTDYNTNVVESTNRAYSKKLTDMQTEADRTTLDSKGRIDKLNADLNSRLTGLGRNAEQNLGTGNLPTLDGYTPIGDVSGKLYEDRIRDINDRKDALYNEKIQSSLKFA